MTFDPLKLIKYHLYLLQLENYELGRFWRLLIKRGWFPPKEQRKNLVWTKKAVLLFAISQVLILSVAGVLFLKNVHAPFAYFWQEMLSILVSVYILDFFTPIFLSVSTILLSPIDWLAKKILVVKASAKIKKSSNIKIIGIAGSYGKTTMKEVLSQVLGTRFKVQATPESVNTPVGIARWVLNKVNDAEIIIVEMGEHYKGDVREICSIAKPDIAVVTGINESHLERMKSLDSVVETIFEIVSASKPGAQIILNGDDKNVNENYKKFVWPDHKTQEFRIENLESRIFDSEKLAWKAQTAGIGEIEVSLLGEYALGDVDAGIKIAQSLGMNAEEIKKGILNIKPVEHRLQPIKSASNILVIDDSYNGNPDGVREAIKVLSKFENRRKIYITPGLVEMGKASEAVHQMIGKQLADVADIVILIKNSVTPWIAGQLIGWSADQLIWFDSAQEAHAGLKNVLKPNDVIVFQNDWGDQYI